MIQELAQQRESLSAALEEAQRIRSMDRIDAKSIPIVALTANAFADNILWMLKEERLL